MVKNGTARILVIEDDKPVADLVRRGLEAEKYTVEVAADGEEAQALAAESLYDLIVQDLNLPNRDGLEVLRSVRS
jgi:DNA-binding response OmpR family regulator